MAPPMSSAQLKVPVVNAFPEQRGKDNWDRKDWISVRIPKRRGKARDVRLHNSFN